MSYPIPTRREVSKSRPSSLPPGLSRKVPMSDDPLDCLTEIGTLTMQRMNSDDDIAPGEAFTLGQIAGIAMRIPEVAQRMKEQEEAGD
jgi:hypothetical protein